MRLTYNSDELVRSVLSVTVSAYVLDVMYYLVKCVCFVHAVVEGNHVAIIYAVVISVAC